MGGPSSLDNTGTQRSTPLVLRPRRASWGLAPFVLHAGRVSIGSGDDADVRVELPGVEKRHCLLLTSARQTVLKAFSPKTWINDGLALESILRVGDRLTVGPAEFIVARASTDELEQFPPTTAIATDPHVPETSRSVLKKAANTRSQGRHTATLAQAASEAAPKPPLHIATRSTPGVEALATLEEVVDQIQLDDSLLQPETVTPRLEKLSTRQPHLLAQENLNRKAAELSAESIALDQQQKKLAIREEDCLLREQAVAKLSDDLALLSADLQHQREQLLGLSEQHRLRDSALAERERDVASQEQEIAESGRNLAALQEELQHRQEQLAERADELTQSRQRVSAQKQQLESLARQLELDREELQERASRIESRSEELQDRSQELVRRASSLEELARELDERQTILEQRLLGCQHRESSLSELAAELDAVRSETTRRESELLDQQTFLDSERVELQQLQQEFAESQLQWDTQRQQQAAELQELREQLSEEQQSLVIARQVIEKSEGEFAERERSLQLLEVQAAEREQSLYELQDRLAERETELSELSVQLDSRESELAGLESTAADREQSIQERQRALNTQAAELAEKDAEQSAREARLDQLCLDLENRVVDLEQRDTALRVREAEVSSRLEAVDERERNLLECKDAFQARLHDLDDRELALEHARQELDAQRQSLADARIDEIPQDSASNNDLLLDARQAQLDAAYQELDAQRLSLQEQQTHAQNLLQEAHSRLQELEQGRSELAAREEVLANRTADLDEQRQTIAALEAELAEREHHLNLQLQVPVSSEADLFAQSELDNRAALLAEREQELESRLASLEADWSVVDQERAELDERHRELDLKDQTLQSLRAEAEQAQARLVALEAESRQRLHDLELRSAQLAEREETFAEHERILSQQAEDLADRDQQLADEQARWDTETAEVNARHERSAAVLDEQRLELLALRQQLEHELRALTLDREEVREQALTADQQSQADYSQEPDPRAEELDAWTLELEQRQRDLEEADAELEFERIQIGVLREELRQERDRLDYEREQLSAQAERLRNLHMQFTPTAAADPSSVQPLSIATSPDVESQEPESLPQLKPVVEIAQPELLQQYPLQDNEVATTPCEVVADIQDAEIQDAGAATAAAPPDDAQALSADDSVLRDDLYESAYDIRCFAPEAAADSANEVVDDPASEEPVVFTTAGVELPDKPSEATLTIRSRLAEMFGLSGSFKLGKERQETPVALSQPQSSSERLAPDAAASGDTDSRATLSRPLESEQIADEPADAIDVEDSVNDENYVSKYVARLLGKTGAPKIPDPPAPAPVSTATDEETQFAAAENDIYSLIAPTPESQSPEAQSRQLQPRARMSSEALRAKMDSFRELANISARAAVARSQFLRIRTRFSMLSAAAAVSWLASFVLFLNARLRGLDDSSTILTSGLFALTVTVLATLSYRELKKLEQTILATSSNEQLL